MGRPYNIKQKIKQKHNKLDIKKSWSALISEMRGSLAIQLFLTPIIVFSGGVKAAFVSGLTFAIIVVLSSGLVAALGNLQGYNRFSNRSKMLVVFFIICLLYVPVFRAIRELWPDTVREMREYLPLIVPYTFIMVGGNETSRVDFYSPINFKRSIVLALVLNVEILMFALIRVFLAVGELGRLEVFKLRIDGILRPFGGFILLGFWLAFRASKAKDNS